MKLLQKIFTWQYFTTRERRNQQIKSVTSTDVSTFESFIEFAKSFPNHHWQPQYLFHPNKLDFIGRLENFKDDFTTLNNHLGIRVKNIPHMKQTGFYLLPVLYSITLNSVFLLKFFLQ